MCFSATASFSLGTTLLLLGALALKEAKHKAIKPFALIPFFFGLQQIAEGFVWIGLTQAMPYLTSVSAYSYLFFALLFWPLYVPFCMRRIETGRRAKVITALLCVGILYVILMILPYLASSAQITGGHIEYIIPNDNYWLLFTVLYCLSVLFPFLLSSNIAIQFFGLAAAIALLLSYIFFMQWAISVWCFFSAILSILILFIVKHQDQER